MILFEKLQFPTDFCQKFNKHSSTMLSVAKATLSVRLDLYVAKLKTYKTILKVRKIQVPTYYRFSTAEGEMAAGGFRSPQLNRVKSQQPYHQALVIKCKR